MLNKELLNYTFYKRLLAYICFGSLYNNIEVLFKADNKFEERFYNMDILSKLHSLLNGSLLIKVFDEDKIRIIKELMKYYLEKYPNENNEIQVMCTTILEQADKQQGKPNDIFYCEQYEIRTGNKCRTVTKEIKTEIDKKLVEDIDVLNLLIALKNDHEVKISLDNENILGALALFMYECPDMFYITSICDPLIMQLDSMDISIGNEKVDRLSDFLAHNLIYIKNYQIKLEELAYYQTFMSMIFRSDLSSVISLMSEEDLKNVFNDELLNTIEECLAKNETECMLRKTQLDNILTLSVILHQRKIIDNQALNRLKVKINQFTWDLTQDSGYIDKNNKYYEQLYKLYMNSSIKLNGKDKSVDKRIKTGLDSLMVETGKVMGETIDFVVPEQLLIWNSDLLFHMNYIMNKYPMILQNEIYADRLRTILQEYYNNVDETKFNITERQQAAYNKVKKKVQKTLR